MEDRERPPDRIEDAGGQQGPDRLLTAVDELRELEREKRQARLSTPSFTEIARRVEEKAREVFRLASQEGDGERPGRRRRAKK